MNKNKAGQNIYMHNQTKPGKTVQSDIQPLLEQEQMQEDNPSTVLGSHYRQQIEEMIKKEYHAGMFNELLESLESSDPLLQHYGIIGIRKLLKFDVLMMRLYALPNFRINHLKFEACFVLSNLAIIDDNFCQLIIKKNGISLFLGLVSEQQNEELIKDKAIFVLGNIAADNEAHRDAIVRSGGVRVLIDRIKTATTRNQVKQSVWVICNICKPAPFRKFRQMNQVCQILCEVLKSGALDKHDNYFMGVLQALFHLTEKVGNEQIQVVRKAGILDVLLKCMIQDEKMEFCVPALKILRNFSTGNKVQAQELINDDFFRVALCLISHPQSEIRREMWWVLSNIAGGTKKQKLALISQKALMKSLTHLLWNQQQSAICEICWIYSFLAQDPPEPTPIIQLILSQQVPEVIIKLLQSKQRKIIYDSLQILENLLQFGKRFKIVGRNVILDRFLQLHIVDLVNRLQNRPHNYEQAAMIGARFFARLPRQ